MKAFGWEYRFRYVLHVVIYSLGFWCPWNALVHVDAPGVNAHVWGLLAVGLTRVGFASLFTAFNELLVLGILFAAAGAGLRTWGAAYLGMDVVSSGGMHDAAVASDGVLRDGPFGYVRNPLYLGTFLHTFALALLMPPSGAVFTIAAIGALQIRLILAEEAFLGAKLGVPYAAYCALVPRVVPVLLRRVAGVGIVPVWGRAFLGEIYFWGFAGSLAVVGWRYNATLLMQCVVVWLGVSLVGMALLKKGS